MLEKYARYCQTKRRVIRERRSKSARICASCPACATCPLPSISAICDMSDMCKLRKALHAASPRFDTLCADYLHALDLLSPTSSSYRERVPFAAYMHTPRSDVCMSYPHTIFPTFMGARIDAAHVPNTSEYSRCSVFTSFVS
jgi:hypothetical protein